MGADLITYIVTGPTKLKCSKKLRAEILRKAEVLIDAAKVCTFPQEKLSPAEEEQAEDKAIETLRAADIDADAAEQVAALDATATLDDLLLLWEGGNFRDVSSRVVTIGGKKIAIVVAGGESWGDEPDGGGYGVLRDAVRLGMLKPLGIK